MTEKTHLQATCVSVGGKAAVFTGASGSGKSTLALRMIDLGAKLIADDSLFLSREENTLVATAPDAMQGKIEVRGVGFINVPYLNSAPIGLFVDMDTEESERLPPYRTIEMLGEKAPLYHRVNGDHFASALTQILLNGRSTID